MSGKKGMKHYSRETKVEAIRLYTEDGKRQTDIAKQLGIYDETRIKIWLRKYRQEGEKAFDRKPRKGLIGRPPKKENQAAYIARLEMENALLKKFHAELRKLELAKRNIGSSNDTEGHTQ